MVFIIAEAGVNHNGNLKTAKALIDVAKSAGADAVKFQSFRAEELSSKFARKANYQKKTTPANESQLEMLKRLELTPEDMKKLLAHCKKRKIVFMSSPFDLKSADFLHRIGQKILKIPSGEINNLPYLRRIGGFKKRIVLSTGMSYLKEIKMALDVLVRAGTKKENITVLHCNSSYPTPYEDVNLLAMKTIKDALNVKVGYSDHTPGIEVAVAAVALGAEVIEKHFTLDKNMKGPDHCASLEPDELKRLVKAVRDVEVSLGNGIKKPTLSELENRTVVRKSIVATKIIKKGDVFTEDNLTAKRPGTGLNPMLWDHIMARKARRDFMPDEEIEL